MAPQRALRLLTVAALALLALACVTPAHGAALARGSTAAEVDGSLAASRGGLGRKLLVRPPLCVETKNLSCGARRPAVLLEPAAADLFAAERSRSSLPQLGMFV